MHRHAGQNSRQWARTGNVPNRFTLTGTAPAAATLGQQLQPAEMFDDGMSWPSSVVLPDVHQVPVQSMLNESIPTRTAQRRLSERRRHRYVGAPSSYRLFANGGPIPSETARHAHAHPRWHPSNESSLLRHLGGTRTTRQSRLASEVSESSDRSRRRKAR